MSAKHTPGPWETDGYGNLNVKSISGRIVACPGGANHFPITEAAANARLIAAAPLLLTALQDAFAQFEHNGEESDGDKAVLDIMQAAIRKATGE